MSDELALLLLINFSMVGLLPLLFFRRDGAFNVSWFLTALPFVLMFFVIVLAWVGRIVPFPRQDSLLLLVLQCLAVPVAATSICLLGMTVGVNRIPLSLWHQDNDAPMQLVTWGPYARIRHPFYSCFLLAFVAALLACPNLLTGALLIYATVVLTVAAIREERRLSASKFGAEYFAYMKHTGRFFPALHHGEND